MSVNERRQAGDTLIEVLLATAILAFIIAGTSLIMNTGLSKAQLSLERTQVQASIEGQASILRALREAAIKGKSNEARDLWQRVGSFAANSNNSTAQRAVCAPGGFNGTRFVFDNSSDSVSAWLNPSELPPITTPQDTLPTNASFLPQPGDGLWIEAYKPSGGPLPYYDFYIKACWDAAGSHPKQELKTVVRLYANS